MRLCWCSLGFWHRQWGGLHPFLWKSVAHIAWLADSWCCNLLVEGHGCWNHTETTSSEVHVGTFSCWCLRRKIRMAYAPHQQTQFSMNKRFRLCGTGKIYDKSAFYETRTFAISYNWTFGSRDFSSWTIATFRSILNGSRLAYNTVVYDSWERRITPP